MKNTNTPKMTNLIRIATATLALIVLPFTIIASPKESKSEKNQSDRPKDSSTEFAGYPAEWTLFSLFYDISSEDARKVLELFPEPSDISSFDEIFRRLSEDGVPIFTLRETTFREERFDPNSEDAPQALLSAVESLQFGQTSKAIHADNRIYFVRKTADHESAKSKRTEKAKERVYLAKRRLLQIDIDEASVKLGMEVEKLERASRAGVSKEEQAVYSNQVKLAGFEADRARALLEQFDAEHQLDLLIHQKQIDLQSSADSPRGLELAKARAELETARQRYTDDHPVVKSLKMLVDELAGNVQR